MHRTERFSRENPLSPDGSVDRSSMFPIPVSVS
jgi:hypothetical protein